MVIALLAAAVCASLQAQDLPEKDPSGNGLDFEPQILLIEPALSDPVESGTSGAVASEADLEKARVRAERAAKKAERWQKLAKSGVLSQVEAEDAALRAAKAEAAYQAARLSAAREEKAPDLTRIEEEEAAARQRLQATELEFARKMVERLRKLRAMRIGSASQLKRAEAALQRIEAGNGQ